MDGAALANTRFAISPLQNTVDALWLLQEDTPATGGGWRELVRETVRDRRLSLLASLFSGSWDYVPDFITPQPLEPEGAVEDELHRVAAVDSGRLRWEIESMVRGHADKNVQGRPMSRAVADVLEQGERALAEGLAAELQQLWHGAIGPHWNSMRARLEADIADRGRTIARHGMSGMLSSLHPRVVWEDDHLRLLTRFQGCVPGTTDLLLTPSVFQTDLLMVIDTSGRAVHRQPMLTYPAQRGPDTEPAALPPAHALLGLTRARLLTDLQSPRSTTELGERHYLATSTVSYHLGILHRAGLVTRTRARHHVLYECTPRAAGLLAGARETS